MILIKIGAGWNGWTLFTSGTDFAFVCADRNAPAPVLELLCG